MTNAKLIRWSGLACIASGVLLFVWWGMMGLIMPAGTEGFSMIDMVRADNWLSVNVIGSVAGILLPLAIIGLYTRQIEEVKMMGFVGFLLAFTGSLLYIWIQVEETLL
ncbi:hypothetical protein ACFL6E_03620 [Candidatus Neomarinimicrobiota bacterium]